MAALETDISLIPSYLTASAASGAFHTSLYLTVSMTITMESLWNNVVWSAWMLFIVQINTEKHPERNCVLI